MSSFFYLNLDVSIDWSGLFILVALMNNGKMSEACEIHESLKTLNDTIYDDNIYDNYFFNFCIAMPASTYSEQ